MVLAEFLTTHLLEPQKRRIRAKSYAETMAMVRSRLLENGINPDDIFPPDAPDAGGGKRDDDIRS